MIIYSIDLFILILFWDLIGLISFFLILLYKNNSSLDIGILVVYINRFSDLFIIIMFIVSLELRRNGFFILGFNNVDYLFFFFSLILKSSQFPLNL